MKIRSQVTAAACGALLAARSTSAITVNLDDQNSIKTAASTIAYGMMTYYNGNISGNTLGALPQPYYWWEAGAMWGSLIDYWYYTGDPTYNDVTTQGLLFQTGPNNDYMPPNQTKDEGNDDQAFWGMAALSAAELNFPDPPDPQPGWLALAQAVFNSQALRWDTTTCNGGLRWQIYTFNTGYNYKNAISNGCFFNMAARLGAYTQNQTYYDWANRMWDWTVSVGMTSPTYQFFDGTNDLLNCSQLNHIQWSYNVGVFLLGAATMWNQTTGAEQSQWGTRVQGIINASSIFFHQPNNVMFEVACEPVNNCDTDQLSFKAYLSRWMAATTKVAPWTTGQIMPLLASSATAAAQSCSGGRDGVTCGTKWWQPGWDGTFGVGQQMSALETIQSNLIQSVRGPVTNTTGGTSSGNPSAGTGGDINPAAPTAVITAGDKAGAGILTTLIIVLLLGGAWWMIA